MKGDARLVAVGNGDARAYEPFGGDSYPLYNGRAMAVVRLVPGAVETVLVARADGIEPAELAIKRKTKNGVNK